MWFYWLRDRQDQKQFNIYWKSSKHNKADYLSKHHPVDHHRNVRPHYIFDPANPKPYFDVDVNYFKPLEDSDDDTVATEPETDVDSDDATVPTSNRRSRHQANCSLTSTLTCAGEGVLIALGRTLGCAAIPIV